MHGLITGRVFGLFSEAQSAAGLSAGRQRSAERPKNIQIKGCCRRGTQNPGKAVREGLGKEEKKRGREREREEEEGKSVMGGESRRE